MGVPNAYSRKMPDSMLRHPSMSALWPGMSTDVKEMVESCIPSKASVGVVSSPSTEEKLQRECFNILMGTSKDPLQDKTSSD